MDKIAFVFSGQGDQYPGMGKSLAEKSPAAARIFQMCDRLRPGTSQMCFEGSVMELQETKNTQPCLFAMELAAYEFLAEKGVQPDMAAGFSLGEVTAATAAGIFDYETGFRLVCLRGEFMQKEAEKFDTSMAAVLKLDEERVGALCSQFSHIYPVNYNCPGQIVITGDKEAVANAAPALKEAGAKRVIPLNVSGPFHSIYLKEAGEKLYQALSEVTLGELKTPYVTNVDASIVTDTTRTKELLKEQVYSSVLWEQSVRAMIADGVDVFVEIGPGKTLSGFMRKIDRNVKMFRIGTMEDIDKTVEAIKEL